MRDLSPEEIALLEAQVPIGILMPGDATIRLVPVDDNVVQTYLGPAAEAVTTNYGIIFWFDVSSTGLVINRMATLNLLAVSNFSARTVPLLRGCVLATGQRGGRPHGLTLEQTRAFRVEAEPVWWVNSVMSVRGERDRWRRRRRRPD
ncbi:hypothetical protein [Mycobacterium avium]|uniref:Uncharacterized protein n=1 Tax=Mycobacterium avium subsp. hominissuis TaxID=439334 RepID=A0AAI8STH3_MYCAV|nr:hypothetical protein [Mycobacterium avium]PBA08443.1 hypothetical protein CKJ70_26320 [Mycobacterium avium]BBN50937.1 hypothetical protein JPH1_54120 [Mycobacterium avium subsp. hominissuis]